MTQPHAIYKKSHFKYNDIGKLKVKGKSQTRLSDFTFTFHFHALEKEMAIHSCSCLENPMDGEAW